MVVCPFHGDQSGNAERIVDRGIATSLDIHKELKSEEIIKAIETVMNNEKYKENVVKLATIIEDVPMKSADKAVWHIEHMIRHGGAEHLKYPQKEIPFYQYHYWDVIIFVCAISSFIVVITFWMTFKLIKCLYRHTIHNDVCEDQDKKIK